MPHVFMGTYDKKCIKGYIMNERNRPKLRKNTKDIIENQQGSANNIAKKL